MIDTDLLTEKLQKLGVGRRRLEEEFFGCDKVAARLGVCGEDEEDLCHSVQRQWATSLEPCACCVLCRAAAAPRYSCGQCRRAPPAPHLLHLHLLEAHDSLFAVAAARAPAYCCYIRECTVKFVDAEERMEHCIRVHKLPKDFRYDVKPRVDVKSKGSASHGAPLSMDVDAAPTPASGGNAHKFFFHNSKRKGLVKYSGKTFTSDNSSEPSRATNMDQIMSDLKQNLPN